MDTCLLDEAYTPKVKAVLTVHLYGRPCYDERLREFVERLRNASRPLLTPTAKGTPEAPASASSKLSTSAPPNYGSDRRYHNIYEGFNCRMDPLQAAFLNWPAHYPPPISARDALQTLADARHNKDARRDAPSWRCCRAQLLPHKEYRCSWRCRSGAYILCGVEAERGSIAKRACRPPVTGCSPYGLRIILHQYQPVRACLSPWALATASTHCA